MSAFGTFQTFCAAASMSALGVRPDIAPRPQYKGVTQSEHWLSQDLVQKRPVNKASL
jgi:hypothetical protein